MTTANSMRGRTLRRSILGRSLRLLAFGGPLLSMIAACPALAKREIPVFRYTGAPKDEARPGAAEVPKGAQKFIPPTGDPSPEGKALDTYRQRGWEDPMKWVSTLDMTKTGGCTGTLIGPQVLLTAAHCIERWPVIDLDVGLHFTRRLIRASCATHPMYRPQGYQSRFDYGLCHLAEPFPEDVVPLKIEGQELGPQVPVLFQRLSTDARDVQARGRLLLAGFGCSSRTSERRDGNIRAGMATVALVSPLRIALGTPFNRDSGVLCTGDSGGPAFRLLSKDPYGPRVLVGVNSASNLLHSVSYVVPTSATAFTQFLRAWRALWGNPKICGLDKDIEKQCHTAR